MDEQTQQALSAFVQKAIEATEKAGDFAVEQAPLVVQEYIARAILYGVRDALIGAVLLTVGLVLLPRGWRLANAYATEGAGVFMLIVSVAMTVIGSAGLYLGASLALSVYVAPRVYILEQLKGLL